MSGKRDKEAQIDIFDSPCQSQANINTLVEFSSESDIFPSSSEPETYENDRMFEAYIFMPCQRGDCNEFPKTQTRNNNSNDDLLAENEHLKEELASVKAENEQLKFKIENLRKCVH